jgi:dTDP-4-amino-4,6-dideoxygalactose transaminase
MNFETVIEFEKKIAEFFGAPYAVAVDSCTHSIELCLRYKNATYINCPVHTYLSVPMLADKLNIKLFWKNIEWKEYYEVHPNIFDAAVLWRKDSYLSGTFMCLSFQYQKHLSLGRGGMILCPDKQSYDQLKKMSYDGRLPEIPWRNQNVISMGYHYYATPETAALGLEKLQKAIETEPRIWTTKDWPNLLEMNVFKNI